MSENTGIRIEVVREVNGQGEKGYRITKIQALTDKDLPELYVDNGLIAILGTGWSNPDNRLYLKNDGKAYCFDGYDYIWPRFYTCKDMKKINAHIKAAGQHLANVNAHLHKERESWPGKVTFVDGVEQEQKKDIPSKKHSAEQLYKITDGSWNLCSTNTGMEHISGLKFVHGKYRIINRGCDLPAYQGCALTPKRNDTIIQNIDTGQIVFTYARFLCQA